MRKRRLHAYSFPLESGQIIKVTWLVLFVFLLAVSVLILRFIGWNANRVVPPDTSIKIDFAYPGRKNNIDLVKYARNAASKKWGYLYGTYGQILDSKLLESCEKTYYDEVAPYHDFIRKNWMGRRVTDCAGLIKSYGWYDPDSGEIKYQSNGMKDLSANGFYMAATEKGGMDSMPEIPGLAVWMDGHIGIYAGGGDVIESMTTTRGVVQTRLQGRGWQYWLKIPSISYDLKMSSAKN
ncbi:MAG TPA: hypothetical protein VHO71_00365 [Caproiciproducens sp.]|nr:hypothetical protein [Caproiciproducens sp.]